VKNLVTCLVITFVLTTQLCAQETSPKQLTMHLAVQQALKHSPDLEALRYAVQANKSFAHSEIAGYYPTLKLGCDISRENGEKQLASNTAINTDQLIYSFSGPLQKYQQAKSRTAVSECDKAIKQNLVRFETEKAFLSAWLIQEQKKSILAIKKSSSITFERQKHKNTLAQLDKNTWLKNIERYGDQLEKIENYQDDKQITYKKLEFLMGESIVVDHLALESTAKNRLQPLGTYYDYAFKLRPEIKRGSKLMDVEHWNFKLEQGQRLPIITTNAEVGLIVTPDGESTLLPVTIPQIETPGVKGPINRGQGYWSVSVSLRWSLFDGLVNQYKAQQAHANKLKEMLAREGEMLRIKGEVHEAYFTLSKVLKQRKTQKLRYMRQHNEFKLAQQKFDLGRLSRTNFNETITSWQKAHFEWLDRNVTVAVAERNLMHACGYPEL